MASLSLINSTSLQCGRSSSFITGNKLQLSSRGSESIRMLALPVKPVSKTQDGLTVQSISNEVKKAGAAVAAALLLSSAVADMSLAQTSVSPLGTSMGDNPLGSAEEILNKAKQVGNDNFAEAQKTGAETVGETANAPLETAPPAISQVDLNADEASEPNADRIAARADYAAENAPGTSQQQGKALNPIEKAFATPTRGIGDKLGENVAQISNRDEKNKNEIPGQGTSGERPGVFNGLFDKLRESSSNRNEGRTADQNVYGTDAK